MKQYRVRVTALIPRPSCKVGPAAELLSEVLEATAPLRLGECTQDVRIRVPIYVELYAEDRTAAMVAAKHQVEDRLTNFPDVSYAVEVV